jgi:hypothetical protein
MLSNAQPLKEFSQKLSSYDLLASNLGWWSSSSPLLPQFLYHAPARKPHCRPRLRLAPISYQVHSWMCRPVSRPRSLRHS